MMYDLNIAEDGDGEVVSSLTVVHQGATFSFTDEHPNYERIVDAVFDGADFAEFLSVLGDFTDDERVDVADDGSITFDGNEVPESITALIQRYAREGRPTEGLKKFLERLNNNPSFRSREQLFNWVQSKALTVDADGYFIGWKGVRSDLTSCTAGKAFVDGVEHEGHIPNAVGSVISMERKNVQDDSNLGCSYGLHVGNYSYAKGFGETLLKVKVDPADVVSVPSDCSYQKLRTARYEVLEVHPTDRGEDLSEYEPEPDDEFDDGWDRDDFYDELDDEVIPQSFAQRLRDKIRGNA